VCSGTKYDRAAGVLCFHCGHALNRYGCMYYPYWCPGCGHEGMEEWEGIDPDEVTDEDHQRWQEGCECPVCQD
jgi:hypothetical protein